MIRYTEQQKKDALASIEKNGVQKTAEESGISVPTLYKWRSETATASSNGDSNATTKQKGTGKKLQQLLGNNQHIEDKLRRLEAENAALRAENKKLHSKLDQMKKVIVAFFA